MLWRESFITTGKKSSIYFVVAGKFYYDRKKKVLSILLWRISFITTGKTKSFIYFVVAGKFYYDRKKKFYLFCCGGKVLLRPEKKFHLFWCGGKVLLRPEKKVLSILLWRESFITTGKKNSIYFVVAGKFYYDRKKKFHLLYCGGKVLLQPEKKDLSILLWRESFITTGKKSFV